MAIQTKKDQNLVETAITDDKIIKTSINPTKKVENTKRVSFLKSVFIELKKVKWPGIKYVASWSVLVILFTGVFSLILGGADHIFESGISFVSCSSTKGKSRDLGTCSSELLKQLIFVSEK
jgi:preprotein translocase SecE subunit